MRKLGIFLKVIFSGVAYGIFGGAFLAGVLSWICSLVIPVDAVSIGFSNFPFKSATLRRPLRDYRRTKRITS